MCGKLVGGLVLQWESPERHLLKGELRFAGQGPHEYSCPAKKEGGLWVQFAPNQCTWQIDQRCAKQGVFSAPAWSNGTGWRVWDAECCEGSGLETVQL